MSETKHTPEPWSQAGPSYGNPQMVEVTEIVSQYDCEEDESETICEFPLYIDKDVRAANARRIVACVNACAGISTEKLEENAADPIAGLFGRMAAREGTRADKAESQRDELLAALKEVVYCSEHFGKAYAGRDARDKAKALINRYDHA